MNPVKVSQINYYIEEHLRTDPILRKVRVIGEVANLKKTGQWAFFHLKDEHALLACVSFEALPDEIQEGNLVIATGAVRYYSKRGTLRMQVSEIAVENPLERKEKRKSQEAAMRKRGWFDRQRPFPEFPKRIGLITSKDGAAVDDVKRNLERRYPFAVLVVIPTLVQGANASQMIEKALLHASGEPLDCLILTRGGGDTSDLEVFDDEKVVRAVYRSPVPVVAAIGHEKDWTFAELAADARASTPTAAAEFVSPTREDIKNRLRDQIWKSDRLFVQHLQQKNKAFLETDQRSQRWIRQAVDDKSASTDRMKRMASRIMLQRLKTAGETLSSAQQTEMQIEKQWSPYRFYLQDTSGDFMKNDTDIPAGHYTIYGDDHKQSVQVIKEEQDGRI